MTYSFIHRTKSKQLIRFTSLLAIGLLSFQHLTRLVESEIFLLLFSLLWLVVLAWPFITYTSAELDKDKGFILTYHVLGLKLNSTPKGVSEFTGIRNRIHWGYGKHCQTELIGNSGRCLIIRVEPWTYKITDSAIRFKNDIKQALNLADKPDLNF